METERQFEPPVVDPQETEKDCPRCSQPLGSNPDCDNCAAAAHWSDQERKDLINARRRQDRKFGLGKKRRF